jgi:putative peptide zinc metalloprotease protein
MDRPYPLALGLILSSLRHPDWHVFADQRFRRRGAVDVSHQTFRGEGFIVLSDKLTGQYLRLAEGARELWQALDGRRSAQEIWEDWMRRPATAPSQPDLVSWLLQLAQQGFILSDHRLDPRSLGERQKRQRSARIEQRAASPLAIRLRLFDPDAVVRALWPVAGLAFTRAGGWAIATLIAVAAVLAALNMDRLVQGADAAILSQSGLVGLVLVYPVMKAVHELAHCLALYRFGGRVHEFGVMLLVLFPVPYVDASESLSLPDKRARMLVSAAGIIAELLMAAIALLVWLVIEPGLERAILFNVIVIGSVSTLLFNGNPLLKFDAYYVLADWLELPNLATRSSDWLADAFGRRVLGLRADFAPDRGEAVILAVYGILSLGYRLVLTATIAFLVSGWFFVIGAVLGIWAVLSGLVWPMAKTAMKLGRTAWAQARVLRAGSRLTVFLLLAYGVLFMVPLPFTVIGSGRIVPLPEAQIVAGGTGRIEDGVLPDGVQVSAGDTLLVLSDPEGAARLASLNSTIAYQDEAVLRSGLTPAEREVLERDRRVAVQMRDEAIRTVTASRLAAPVGGRLVWADGMEPRAGSHLFRGQQMGYVAAVGQLQAVAALPAALSGIARNRVRGMEALLPDGTRLALQLSRDQVVDVGGTVPPELLVARGGTVPEDPEAPGRVLETVWVVWAGSAADLAPFAGMRMDLRLDLGTASAVEQVYHYAQRLFLRVVRM